MPGTQEVPLAGELFPELTAGSAVLSGLTADPSPNFHPIIDSVPRYSFCPYFKLLCFDHLSYIGHSTLYT